MDLRPAQRPYPDFGEMPQPASRGLAHKLIRIRLKKKIVWFHMGFLKSGFGLPGTSFHASMYQYTEFDRQFVPRGGGPVIATSSNVGRRASRRRGNCALRLQNGWYI
jgi:hypothetical protein